jgi:UDP-2,4-diacetamido-2,4,6-trideoxy-beta-L-altropyranose hydrolase
MRVVFRADASTRIGSGHVMRCATLAEELQRRGATVSFLCRAMEGDYIEWLSERGIEVTRLPGIQVGDGGGNCADNYADWLGVPLEQEIAQVTACLETIGAVDWLVVDHYALDAEWDTAMRGRVDKILCIDDLANRNHDCDLLLDQNYCAEPASRYAGLVPEDAMTLVGPRYALLRPEFALWRSKLRARDGTVGRIMLFMGGSDSANVTCAVLKALALRTDGAQQIRIDVVTGKANPYTEEIGALCTRMTDVSLHHQVDNMAELMAATDLAIGAAGASTWERAALGVPTLAVTVAENQREIARYAAQCGVLTWLGDAKPVSIVEWRARIDEACSSPEVLRSQSKAGLALIDVCGTTRVIEAML